jgi:hypothetical protein
LPCATAKATELKTNPAAEEKTISVYQKLGALNFTLPETAAVPSHNSKRMENRSSGTVDNFVAAKAPNFNEVQQTSTSAPQRLQQPSLRIKENP